MRPARGSVPVMSEKRRDSGLCRTQTYRLKPSPRQVDCLERLLESQRVLYNAALEHRIAMWRWANRSVSLFDRVGPACQSAKPAREVMISRVDIRQTL